MTPPPVSNVLKPGDPLRAASLALLEYADEFVRFAAINAVVALGAKEALPKLKAMFLASDAMAGPVIEGYGAMKQTLDPEILAKLDAARPRPASPHCAPSNLTSSSNRSRCASPPMPTSTSPVPRCA